MEKHLALYDRLGFNVIPLKPQDKRPALQSWSAYMERLSTKDERALWWGRADRRGQVQNVGIVTGAVSRNLVVLDFDDAFAYATACASIPWLAETLHVSTGRGHHVYLYAKQDPGATFSMKLDGAEGVHHIKANGGYVVAPPSIHPSGSVYKWDNLYDWDMDEPLTIDLGALVPALVAAGFKRSNPPAREIPAGFWDDLMSRTYGEGERASVLVKVAGVLLNGILSEGIAYELARSWNATHLQPPLSDEEVRGTIRSVYSRYTPKTN